MKFNWFSKSLVEHGHTQAEIDSRLEVDSSSVSYLKDAIYGGMDGAVTTLAIVAGVAGAGIDRHVVMALGVANVLADGFSMAASNYSGSKAESDRVKRLQSMEERHIQENPEGERLEVIAILKRKGLTGTQLFNAVDAITAHRGFWVDVMLLEEHGVSPLPVRPFGSAVITFLAFVLCGAVPLIPFLFAVEQSYELTALLTGMVFLTIGAVKSRWTLEAWWLSALKTFSIGATAAYIAWHAGRIVGHMG